MFLHELHRTVGCELDEGGPGGGAGVRVARVCDPDPSGLATVAGSECLLLTL